MSDKENILLDPAEMDKIENIPEIKTVSEEDLPAEAEVKEQFEEKPAPTASPDYTDAVPEASKPEHIGERSVCSIDALIQKILDGERQSFPPMNLLKSIITIRKESLASRI